MSYRERLVNLNLLPLDYRREISDLLLFFKSRNGFISTDIRKYLRTFEPCYRTRKYEPNNYNLIYEYNQDYYRESYFIRSAKLWNLLPSSTKAITVEPRFNEVPRDWVNLFVISRVRYIENLDTTNLRKNKQNIRYIEV